MLLAFFSGALDATRAKAPPPVPLSGLPAGRTLEWRGEFNYKANPNGVFSAGGSPVRARLKRYRLHFVADRASTRPGERTAHWEVGIPLVLKRRS